jgi:hypothetical protein
MGNRSRMNPAAAPGGSMGLRGLNDVRLRNEALRGIQGMGQLIYAVRTNDELIKIGCSGDLAQRLRHIRGGVDQILAIKPGGFADERAIHQRLKGHAAEGREFYLPTLSVLLVVNEMRAVLGLDPVVFERRWAS